VGQTRTSLRAEAWHIANHGATTSFREQQKQSCNDPY
jgi:hypothetical protein